MDIYAKYIPMTETAYYILLVLNEPLHGYGIIQKVEQITEGRIHMGPGTIYGTLSKLEKDGVIEIVSVTQRRKVYVQSDAGKKLILYEISRIKQLLDHAERSGYNDKI